jgi:hypothetical protein
MPDPKRPREPIKTDPEVRLDGLRTLVDALGTVEAERFISLMFREPFGLSGKNDLEILILRERHAAKENAE